VAKVTDLAGVELDGAVARAEIDEGQLGIKMSHGGPIIQGTDGLWEAFRPSVTWAHAGPIIEREQIALLSTEPGHCVAAIGAEWADGHFAGCRVLRAGPTQLVAAMRVYVDSRT